MRKFTFLLLGCLILFNACQKKTESDNKPTVKIGVIAPLSGNLAFFGEDLRRGILLASKNIPQQSKFEYKLIFEDDQFDNKKTVLAAQKLINVDQVDCIITMFSDAGPLVAPIAEKNKVVHFGMAWDERTFEGFYNFNHWPRVSRQISVLIQKLLTLPYKKIGIIMANSRSFVTITQEFETQLSKTPIEVVFKDILNTEERDFKNVLTKAQNSPAEFFFIAIDQPGLDIFMKKWREWNMSRLIVSVDIFEDAQNPQWYEGYFYSAPGEPSEEFIKKFTGTYQTSPKLLSPHSYDILNILVSTYEKYPLAKKPSTHEIAEALLSTKNFDGVFGKLEMDSDGNISGPVVIKQYKNGKKIVLDQP